MEKFELIIVRPSGKEEVIKRNLTEQQAIEYFENIDNTYYREQKQTDGEKSKMLKKVFIKGNAYFDTYYIKDTEKDKYIGIIEDHCRGVVEQYFIGWKFKDNEYIPNTYRAAKTQMFDSYEEALSYIQEEF